MWVFEMFMVIVKDVKVIVKVFKLESESLSLCLFLLGFVL